VTNAIAAVSHHKLDGNSVSPAFVQPMAVSTVIHVDVWLLSSYRRASRSSLMIGIKAVTLGTLEVLTCEIF
jgi:hypothetical protein